LATNTLIPTQTGAT